MKARVDRELCQGLGNCVVIAPSVFQFDSEKKATVLDPASVAYDVLMEAAESCALNAIVIEDDNGNQLYP